MGDKNTIKKRLIHKEYEKFISFPVSFVFSNADNTHFIYLVYDRNDNHLGNLVLGYNLSGVVSWVVFPDKIHRMLFKNELFSHLMIKHFRSYVVKRGIEDLIDFDTLSQLREEVKAEDEEYQNVLKKNEEIYEAIRNELLDRGWEERDGKLVRPGFGMMHFNIEPDETKKKEGITVSADNGMDGKIRLPTLEIHRSADLILILEKILFRDIGAID